MQRIILEILAVTALSVHLWCVNISSAAPLLSVLLHWRSRRENSPYLRHHARGMGILAIGMLWAGALAGLALAGIMWLQADRELFAILPRFATRIYWGLGELAFYLFCLSIYVALFARRPSRRVWVRPLQALLAVLASANLLYHFPPLFTVMANAANAPESVSSSVTPSEFRSLMLRAHIIALTVHFAFASFSVAALVMMYRFACSDNSEQHASARSWGLRMGAAVALAATGMQLMVGLWVLASLSPLSQSRLMGRDFVGTSGLVVSVLLTFWLLHRLANACLSDASVPQIRGTMLILLLIVLLMTATLRRAENGRSGDPTYGVSEGPPIVSEGTGPSSHGVRRLLSSSHGVRRLL